MGYECVFVCVCVKEGKREREGRRQIFTELIHIIVGDCYF